MPRVPVITSLGLSLLPYMLWLGLFPLGWQLRELQPLLAFGR
jgi:hypothetical protein